jgi:multicomponent Na+:H+ antiporter subunit D
MIDWFHPSILFIVGAFLIPFLRGKLRQSYLMLIPLLAVGSVFLMSPGTYWTCNFLGTPLTFGAVDKLSIVFGWVFTIASFISIVYALHVEEPGQHMAAFLYVGGSLGVTFAGDFFTLFVFWELMAFSSATWRSRGASLGDCCRVSVHLGAHFRRRLFVGRDHSALCKNEIDRGGSPR